MSTVFSFKGLVRTLSISVPLTLIFCDNVAYIARVDGVSMQPTLNPKDDDNFINENKDLNIPSTTSENNTNNQNDFNRSFRKYFYKFNSSDLIILSHWATRNYQIQRGYVVSLVSPNNPNQIIIKRVIGLEGDTVIARRNLKFESIKIPKGHCWVEGDNHCKSMDSNIFGPVAVGLITAQAKYVIWPPKRWKTLPNELPLDRIMKKVPPTFNKKFNGSYYSGESLLIDLKDNQHHQQQLSSSTNKLDLLSMLEDAF